MVSREQLRLQGLRAYELGRLRAATRVGLVVIPAAAICLISGGEREACACIATLLLGVCIWLRWRDRRGFEVVTLGLQAGAVPLVVGLTLDRFGIECSVEGGSVFCLLFAVLAGGASGAYISSTEAQSSARLGSVLTAGGIAALAGALGCVRLGIVGTTSVLVGMALGLAVPSIVRCLK